MATTISGAAFKLPTLFVTTVSPKSIKEHPLVPVFAALTFHNHTGHCDKHDKEENGYTSDHNGGKQQIKQGGWKRWMAAF